MMRMKDPGVLKLLGIAVAVLLVLTLAGGWLGIGHKTHADPVLRKVFFTPEQQAAVDAGDSKLSEAGAELQKAADTYKAALDKFNGLKDSSNGMVKGFAVSLGLPAEWDSGFKVTKEAERWLFLELTADEKAKLAEAKSKAAAAPKPGG